MCKERGGLEERRFNLHRVFGRNEEREISTEGGMENGLAIKVINILLQRGGGGTRLMESD